MKYLYLIPSRAGSKGLPGKNTKILGDKPLFMYSVLFALEHMNKDDELCISTNDKKVIEFANDNKIIVPFIRPEIISTDTSTIDDVIRHALRYYKEFNKCFDAVILLQPTSPFRSKDDLINAKSTFSNCEIVITVNKSKDSPYFNIYEENESGYLLKSKSSNATRRQDCPDVYKANGSIYIIDADLIMKKNLAEFEYIKKVVMPDYRSVDIDNSLDWAIAENLLISNNKI